MYKMEEKCNLQSFKKMNSLIKVSEGLCYLGVSLSAIIAFRLTKMEKLSFLNKMFVIYFLLDFLIGTMETYLLFTVYRER